MDNELIEAVALEPCPFCGGAAELEEVDGGCWSVGCEEKSLSVHYCMGYQSLTSFATKREAIAAWNARTPLASLKAENEALRQLGVAVRSAALDALRHFPETEAAIFPAVASATHAALTKQGG